jgi:tRNA G37 N-methylase Trm5
VLAGDSSTLVSLKESGAIFKFDFAEVGMLGRYVRLVGRWVGRYVCMYVCMYVCVYGLTGILEQSITERA